MHGFAVICRSGSGIETARALNCRSCAACRAGTREILRGAGAATLTTHHDSCADEHQHERPRKFPYIQAHEAKRVEQEPAADDNEHQRPQRTMPLSAL